MGFFSSLFGKKKPEFAERIWMTEEHKLSALLSRVQSRRAKGQNTVVVTHFADTQQTLLAALEGTVDEGLHIVTTPSQFPAGTPEFFRAQGQLLLLASDAIPAFLSRPASAQKIDPSIPPVAILMAEHYPIPTRDQTVLDLANAWPIALDFNCYTSLDEPWLAMFVTDQIRDMLAKMGMKEDEMLDSALLTNSLRSAQKKIAKSVTRETPAPSCEAWMHTNLPTRA